MSFRSGSAEDVAGEERSGKRQTGGNGQRPGGGCADGGKICRFRKEVKRENRCAAGRNFPVTVPFDRISTVKKREERRGAYNEGRRYCWQCLLCASVFYPALSDRRFQRLTCACPLHVRCRCRKRASGIRNIERPAGLTPGRPLSDVPGCLCLFCPSYDMVTAAPAPMALCEPSSPNGSWIIRLRSLANIRQTPMRSSWAVSQAADGPVRGNTPPLLASRPFTRRVFMIFLLRSFSPWKICLRWRGANTL